MSKKTLSNLSSVRVHSDLLTKFGCSMSLASFLKTSALYQGKK